MCIQKGHKRKKSFVKEFHQWSQAKVVWTCSLLYLRWWSNKPWKALLLHYPTGISSVIPTKKKKGDRENDGWKRLRRRCCCKRAEERCLFSGKGKQVQTCISCFFFLSQWQSCTHGCHFWEIHSWFTFYIISACKEKSVSLMYMWACYRWTHISKHWCICILCKWTSQTSGKTFLSFRG